MPIAVTLVSIEELALLDARVWSFLTADQQVIVVGLLVDDARADLEDADCVRYQAYRRRLLGI